jgi:Sec-independent protein secretion pathway component TatC
VAALGPAHRRRRAGGLTAARPGTDPVTTLVELVPMLALFEMSVLLVGAAERRVGRAEP